LKRGNGDKDQGRGAIKGVRPVIMKREIRNVQKGGTRATADYGVNQLLAGNKPQKKKTKNKKRH